MDNVVEQLVLAPFREIAEKAKAAVENAGNAGDQVPPLMRKAAEGLAKEGDRALTRIEPLCTRNYEQYGANFVDAIKEHDEIAQYRRELEGLLWDFEDYITVEDYDGDKFEQLRGASRQAAPKIVDILKRMKLVEPAYPTLSPKSLSLRAPSIASRSSLILGDAPPAEGSAPGTPSAGGDLDRTPSHQSGTSAHPAEPPPPRPPSANPWQVGSPPGPPSEAHDLWSLGEGPAPEQRPDVVADSPTLPAARLRRRPLPGDDRAAQEQSSSLTQVVMPVDDATERVQGALAGSRARANSAGQRPVSPYDIRRLSVQTIDSPVSPLQPRGSLQFPLATAAIPENSAVGSHEQCAATWGNFSAQPHRYSPYSPLPPEAKQTSIGSFDSFFDILRAKDATGAGAQEHTPTSPLSPPGAAQPLPSSERPSSELGRAHSIDANGPAGAAFPRIPRAAEGLEVVPQPAAPQRYSDPGIIPLVSEEPEEPHMPPRKPDCSIGPHSSFYQCKGFCKGAESAVARGDAGYKRIKRPMGGFSTMIVAKCNTCSFELDYRQVELDMKNEASGNLSSDGIRFRLRFLRKSHIHCKYVDEQLFGCIFCIKSGNTLEESDATVFLGQKQLFSHMARHPRPLPMVSGFTIFEGDAIPAAQKDDYDLWFTRAPVPSQMQGISPEVGKLPAAVATETRKMMHGILRTPPDKAPVLQYAVGARIVGIEFPAKYEGKWGIGWHDGMYGVFEVDTVRLEAPPRNEVRMHGTSNMQAVARWRFRQAGEGNWLKFDKGDVIKNISWAYTDHWCWSGTSSKNWGIFPQSHIEPNTLSDKRPGDDSSIASERKTPLSPFRSRNSDPPESPPIRRVTTGSKIHRILGV